MRHEIFGVINTQTRRGRTDPLYVNVNQWSGWIFNGDGTATTDVRATLWGLAELVTGDGNNWTKIVDYSGDPEKLPIGQRVDYRGLTKKIQAEILIVEDSGHTDESVKGHITKAIQILNPQQVAISLEYFIKHIKSETTTGFNLSDVQVGLETTGADINYNRGLMNTIGKGIIAETEEGVDLEEEVDLFDTSGEVFFQIYTNQILDNDNRPNNTNTLGFGFFEVPTMLLSAGLMETTVAHELCHNFSLEHENNPNNLMYPVGDSRIGSDLTRTQIMQIKQFLGNPSNEFVRPEGY